MAQIFVSWSDTFFRQRLHQSLSCLWTRLRTRPKVGSARCLRPLFAPSLLRAASPQVRTFVVPAFIDNDPHDFFRGSRHSRVLRFFLSPRHAFPLPVALQFVFRFIVACLVLLDYLLLCLKRFMMLINWPIYFSAPPYSTRSFLCCCFKFRGSSAIMINAAMAFPGPASDSLSGTNVCDSLRLSKKLLKSSKRVIPQAPINIGWLMRSSAFTYLPT